MFVIVAYDISTKSPHGKRRLKHIAKICQDHGIRVQKSIFECSLPYSHFLSLRTQLLEWLDPSSDSLRFYFLSEYSENRVEIYGSSRSIDLLEPLLF
jgi:CRISPR-associated protein Cas2